MHRFGLLKAPGGTSRSPELYQKLWSGHPQSEHWSYQTLDLEPGIDWVQWLKVAHDQGWSGFNATVPHKIDVWNAVLDRTPVAQAVGASNCLVRTELGWQCHNTDADGFWLAWQSAWGNYRPEHHRVWLLGNGGVARAIAHALMERGFEVLVFARTPRPNFFGLNQMSFSATAQAPKPDLVVNATSLGHGRQSGLAPEVVWPPLQGGWAMDAVYGDEPSLFEVQATQAGARVLDGIPMLEMQAKKAWDYWSSMLGIADF